jgi:hypothetical protein
MNDKNRVLARLAGQPSAILEDQALRSDRATLAGFTVLGPASGGRMTNRMDGVEVFREKMRGEKLIKGWIAGLCAEADDLRGLNTLMLEYVRSHR